MFLGHFGVALAAKRAAPKASLGSAILAAQFLDLLWPLLLLAGVEHVRVVPGLMAANSLDFTHYPYSHSLAAALVWAGLLGACYGVARRYPRGALVVAALVVSHWVLDVPMHRPDLPLWPGSTVRVGGGAWNSLPLTVLLELGLLAAGLAVYLQTTRARDGRGRWGLWALMVVLVAFFLGATFGPPPPSERGVALGTVGLWLFVPWGYWVDRQRELRGATAAATLSEGPSGPGTPAPLG